MGHVVVGHHGFCHLVGWACDGGGFVLGSVELSRDMGNWETGMEWRRRVWRAPTCSCCVCTVVRAFGMGVLAVAVEVTTVMGVLRVICCCCILGRYSVLKTSKSRSSVPPGISQFYSFRTRRKILHSRKFN